MTVGPWPERLGSALRDRLAAAYGDASRGYHDTTHLREVLARVDDIIRAEPGLDPLREEVVIAAWFHDAVYAGRADDEEQSSRLAETTLDGLAEAGLVAEVARLVRLTATHDPSDDDVAGQILCDADLGVLAADPDRYASYVRGVRADFAHVNDRDFAAGRAAVLRDLLSRPALFHTRIGRTSWEARARENLERELSELTTEG